MDSAVLGPPAAIKAVFSAAVGARLKVTNTLRSLDKARVVWMSSTEGVPAGQEWIDVAHEVKAIGSDFCCTIR